MAVARDKFWVFTLRAHEDDQYLGANEFVDRNYTWSRITPAESAFMLDVPNLLMVNSDGIPVPFSADAYGYAESFVRLKKVMWSSTGSAGFRIGNEEKFICDLAEKYPNICGTFMDDPFHRLKNDPNAIETASNLIKEVRTGLDKACRPMELYITWYAHQTGTPESEVLNLVDGISIWTSKPQELLLLEERFEKLEKQFPHKKKLLGIYFYNFIDFLPVPLDLMEHQCELGLRLLKEKRIDGMIFLSNTVMGVGLPSEKWLREWIDKVKYTEIPD